MNNAYRNLRREAEEAKTSLADAQRRPDIAVRSCTHKWGPVEADHIYKAGYQIPGDPPGTMGVDWRGPSWVEATTEKRWKRVCKECGEVEYTSRTTQCVTEDPEF